jgi:hypothetical protein
VEECRVCVLPFAMTSAMVQDCCSTYIMCVIVASLKHYSSVAMSVVLHFPVIVGFFILLAPRVEAVTGTEVFDMHLSTALQFLTFNYPREMFCTPSEACSTQRISCFNCEFAYMTASVDQSSFTGREVSQDPGAEP